MKRLALCGLMFAAGVSGAAGCSARPGEWGWTPAYTEKEKHDLIARNWDYEGKQLMDDLDTALLLRPASHLTIWNVR